MTIITADSKTSVPDKLDIYTGQMLTKKNYLYAEYVRKVEEQKREERKTRILLFSLFAVIIGTAAFVNTVFPV